VSSSFVAIMEMSVYEYDLKAMDQAAPELSAFFFITFMIIVTNLFYWLSFAAFFNAVEEARLRSLEQVCVRMGARGDARPLCVAAGKAPWAL